MEASCLLPRGSSWAGNYCKKKMSEPGQMTVGGATSKDRGPEGEPGKNTKHARSLDRETAEYSPGQAAHLGEADLEVPQAAAGGHPLGGLTVLGELQGGRRLMTRRPQAAMLRFIWEALRKSWPRGGR